MTCYSPPTGQAEPSWAIKMPVDENVLSVTGCEEGAPLVEVGDFLSRLNAA